MKIFINTLLTTSLLFILGCNKTVKAPITNNIEVNKTAIQVNTRPLLQVAPVFEVTPVVEVAPALIVEETIQPEYNLYEPYSNDELLIEGVASKIVVIKSKKVMVVFDKYDNILSRHRISLGKNNVGTKLQRGDYKTPEGVYNVVNKRGDKKYYKQIRISYPNAEDKQRSRELGFNPGGGITIHAQVPWNWNGRGNDYTLSQNWTQGCIAMTNEGMDMIWNNVSPQTVVDIRE